MFALVAAVLLWISAGWSGECVSVDDRRFLADIKELDSNRNVPALFKRTYKEWIEETRCINESLKSSEANIKHKGPLRFSMKARIAARSGKPLLKVNLWIEFYNVSKGSSLNTFEAIIRPADSRIQQTNETTSEKVISERGRLLELAFNVTDIYYTSSLLGKKYVQFRISIHGHPKKSKDLLGADSIKAFLVIHEFEEVCNEYLPVRRPGRNKRSPPDYLESGRSRHVLNGHQLRVQSTLRTMGDTLRDTIATHLFGHQRHPRVERSYLQSTLSKIDFEGHHRHKPQKNLEHKHHKKRSSRPYLKSLHPDSSSHTRTSCGLNDWYVSFDYIGWNSWVIAPSGVRARTCSGVCSFPMGSDINSTAHAHLQSFVYYFKGEKWPACCVPNDFEPLTMILYDVTDQLPFMAKYPNMIATSCACL